VCELFLLAQLRGCGFHMGEILIRKVKWANDEEMLEFLDQLRLELDHAVCCAHPADAQLNFGLWCPGRPLLYR
jgi:hypothetical protein